MTKPIIIRPDDIYTFVIGLAALITSAGVIVAQLMKLHAKIHAPQKTHELMLKNHEDRLNEHDIKFAKIAEALDRDLQRLREQEESNEVTQKSLLAIMNNMLNEKNEDGLRNAKNELERYLIHKKNTV